MSDWTLIGLASTYKEGSLCGHAIQSLAGVCDAVYWLDGPAGEPLGDDLPDSDGGAARHLSRVHYREGRWRTDARKRQALLDWARDSNDGPLWGVILDGDEILMGGEYLRDWLQVLEWEEEQGGGPYLGRPIRGVEMSGAVFWLRGRLLRLDRVREYKISTSVIVNENGIEHAEGNHPDSFQRVWRDRHVALEQSEVGGKMYSVPIYGDDQVFVGPPVPGEPFILHRPLLRHPLRRGVGRMHVQERDELVREGLIEP